MKSRLHRRSGASYNAQAPAGPHFAHRVIGANFTAGVVIAIGTAGLAVAGDGIPKVDTSKSAVLHISDAPLAIGTAGTPKTVAAPTRSSFRPTALPCAASHASHGLRRRAQSRTRRVLHGDEHGRQDRIGDGIVFGFDEQARRRAYIASLRESNAAAHAALEAEIARAPSRDRSRDDGRRELPEFSEQEARGEEQRRGRERAGTRRGSSFEATARAIEGLLGENEVLRKDMASLREESPR